MALEDKKKMAHRTVFPHPPADPVEPLPHYSGRAHQRIDKTSVRRALFDQTQTKTPGPDRLNFNALNLLWSWDARRVTTIIR